MLRELSAREEEKNRRRWFSDDYFDLIVWLAPDRSISGFQLCYDKKKNERALTWTKDKGYRHEAVDAGEENPAKNRTPILIPDGKFPIEEITRLFLSETAEVDRTIVLFVAEKLREYEL